jgi:hypothetical protein
VVVAGIVAEGCRDPRDSVPDDDVILSQVFWDELGDTVTYPTLTTAHLCASIVSTDLVNHGAADAVAEI